MVHWTKTLKAALGIGTFPVKTRLRTVAFVDIRAVSTGIVQFVSVVALTAEHAERIFAFPEHAQIVEHLAFVYV